MKLRALIADDEPLAREACASYFPATMRLKLRGSAAMREGRSEGSVIVCTVAAVHRFQGPQSL